MSVRHIDLSKNELIIVDNISHLKLDNHNYIIIFKKQEEILWVRECLYLKGVCDVVYWANHKVCLFSDEQGESIIKISLENGICNIIEKLNREDNEDPDFYRSDFVDIDDGCLFVYEGGLIKFDLNINVSWHIRHQRIDWFFTGIRNGSARYENEYDGEWGYRLADGIRVD